MPKENILVVEDEHDIMELITYNLIREGYRVSAVSSGEEALTAIHESPPDLVMLDIMMPGLDGLEVCRRLKADNQTARIPVIMLTSKGRDSDVVRGLEMGADDYIVKPFSNKVVNARIRAVLRRLPAEKDEGEFVQIHDLMINPGKHEVMVHGEPVELTFTEFKILHYLTKHPGWVYTRYQIVEAVRGQDYIVTDRAVDVQIVGLRKKLGSMGKYIETVRGIGYRFREING
ncbi:MAG: response regulator [SAR324 cluster bacterium]|nr:response regulator [SAR324 cluster bacterium]